MHATPVVNHPPVGHSACAILEIICVPTSTAGHISSYPRHHLTTTSPPPRFLPSFLSPATFIALRHVASRYRLPNSLSFLLQKSVAAHSFLSSSVPSLRTRDAFGASPLHQHLVTLLCHFQVLFPSFPFHYHHSALTVQFRHFSSFFWGSLDLKIPIMVNI